MKPKLLIIAAFGLPLLSLGCQEQALSPAADAPAILSAMSLVPPDVADQYLLRFKDGILPEDLDARVAGAGGILVFSHDVGIAIVGELDVGGAAQLGAYDDVAQIQQDGAVELDPIGATSVEVAGAAVASPDDPTTALFYPWQWNMRAIQADQAWAAGRLGSPAVTVAILDTGIDYMYPDLAGRVDLSRSVSFVPDDDALVSTYFPGRHPITDLHYHGTHVASTAVSNANLVAGVTTMTTLLGIKVCSVYGSCPFSSIIQGVLHAADNGADVANMSLGGGFVKAEAGQYVGFINSVFNYANDMGMVVIVSAGNGAFDLDHDANVFMTYCSAPNTMCVAATGPTGDEGREGPWTAVDAPAPYTNYGRSAISVAAPGGTGNGFVWAACSQTSLVLPICQTAVYVLGLTGTSMSAAHTSGLASLVVEDVGRNPGRIKTTIQRTADDLGDRGVDPFYGKGRINIADAIH